MFPIVQAFRIVQLVAEALKNEKMAQNFQFLLLMSRKRYESYGSEGFSKDKCCGNGKCCFVVWNVCGKFEKVWLGTAFVTED